MFVRELFVRALFRFCLARRFGFQPQRYRVQRAVFHQNLCQMLHCFLKGSLRAAGRTVFKHLRQTVKAGLCLHRRDAAAVHTDTLPFFQKLLLPVVQLFKRRTHKLIEEIGGKDLRVIPGIVPRHILAGTFLIIRRGQLQRRPVSDASSQIQKRFCSLRLAAKLFAKGRNRIGRIVIQLRHPTHQFVNRQRGQRPSLLSLAEFQQRV